MTLLCYGVKYFKKYFLLEHYASFLYLPGLVNP